ncbi:MAG TPA: MFS transporter, partial [Polyangiaceae bacterium]
FRNRVFASASLALVLSFLGLFATSFLLPFYLEQLRGYSPERAGLTLTALPLTIAVVSPMSGALADRIGSRFLCVTGMSIATLGLVMLGQLGATTPQHEILVALAITGAGQAMFQPANNSALMGAAPPERRGVASGILATARVVGQSMSIAVTGAIFTAYGAARAGHALGAGSADPTHDAEFLAGFRAALSVCATITLLAALASTLRGPEPRRPMRTN